MARTRQQEIIDKMKGTIAEELFIQLHAEIGCMVFRSGTEFLYPNLYPLSKLKQNLYTKEHMEDAINDAAEVMAELAVANLKNQGKHDGVDEEELIKHSKNFFVNDKTFRNKIMNDHFHQKPLAHEVYSAPDFTIITPSGLIAQVEVKYRANGIVEQERLDRIIKYHPYALIFVFMEEEPYINIYYPFDHRHLSCDATKEEKEQYQRFQELSAKKLMGAITKEEDVELELLQKKCSILHYEIDREYETSFMDRMQDHISESRKQGVPDERILISGSLPDYSNFSEMASVSKVSYYLATLKRYAEILKASIKPLQELYKKG